MFRALLDAKRIREDTVARMLRWTHSGFHAHRGGYLEPTDSEGRQRVLRYLMHPPFALERMAYDAENAVVTYRSDRQSLVETFHPLEWLARLASHIPEKGTQTVRHLGAYSNRVRGMRKKLSASEQPPVTDAEPAPPKAPEAVRRSWARLLAAVWKADPLVCTRCGARMRILAAVLDPDVVRKILRHLALWDVPARAPPPRGRGRADPDPSNPWFDEEYPQVPQGAPEPDEQPLVDVEPDASAPFDPWMDVWPEADPHWQD